jgi:hypothetical protein
MLLQESPFVELSAPFTAYEALKVLAIPAPPHNNTTKTHNMLKILRCSCPCGLPRALQRVSDPLAGCCPFRVFVTQLRATLPRVSRRWLCCCLWCQFVCLLAVEP